MVSDEKNLAGLPWVVALSQVSTLQVCYVVTCIIMSNSIGILGHDKPYHHDHV